MGICRKTKVLLNIPRFDGPSTIMLNKGSLTSIAFNSRKTANNKLLVLYFVLSENRKNARNSEMNKETIFTIINKLILSITYFSLFMVIFIGIQAAS